MKKIFSDTKFIHKNLKGVDNIVHDIEHIGYKKEDVYNVIDGKMVKSKTVITKPKNIFSIYTEACYNLYQHIAIAVDHACKTYDINKKAQKYMMYGKHVKYLPEDSNKWYDFPGQNIPFLHGFYFAKVNEATVHFNNGVKKYSEKVVSGDLVLNKPTDLIRIDVDQESDVIEFYVSPLFALKNNEPGVWVPII